MKTPFLPLLLASVATLSLQAQSTTVPVGFITVDLPADSDVVVGVPLHRQAEYAGPVASITDNLDGTGEITLSGASLTADQFVYDGSTITDNFYVRIKSGDREGMWYHITDNDADTLFVDTADDPNFADIVTDGGSPATNTVEVVPYWTLGTLFENGGDLDVVSDLDNITGMDTIRVVTDGQASNVVNDDPVAGFRNPVNKIYFYYDGSDSVDYPSAPAGWYDFNTYQLSDTSALVPDSHFIIRNVGSSQSVTISGTVPSASISTLIVKLDDNERQDNLMINPFPVAISLSELALESSSGFTPVSDLDNIDAGDTLRVFYNNTGFNQPESAVYFYYDGSDSLDYPSVVSGWYNYNTYQLEEGDIILPGSGFILRKNSGSTSSGEVKTTMPYSL